MREHKYRVWDTENECMMEDVTTCGTLEELFILGDIFVLDRYKVMQWIGSKDKNGVDIYEGDIIKGRYAPFSKNKVEVGVVSYSPTWFYLKFKRGFGSIFNQSVVIGNIFENPEFLK